MGWQTSRRIPNIYSRRPLPSGKVLNWIAMIALVAVQIFQAGGLGRARSLSEYQVKAAYLYNFAKFVEWPNEALEGENRLIILAVLGRDPFHEALDPLRGKTVKGRKLVIKRFKSVRELEFCHILFVSSSERDRLPHILKGALKSWSVLTIGDVEGFADSGGVIRLFFRKNNIRFKINLDAARQKGLTISSKLLRLADIVRGSPGQIGERGH